MRFTLVVFLILSIPFTGFSQTDNIITVVEVKLHEAKLIYNNHVGNEWGYEWNLKNRIVKKDGKQVTLLSNPNKGSISLKVYEIDKYSDISEKEVYFGVYDLKWNEEKIIKTSIIVRENRGRYSGNTAKWVFEFKIKVV